MEKSVTEWRQILKKGRNEMDRYYERLRDMIVNAYIEAMGVDKWISLTNKEKHDVVMAIARDLLKALD